MPLYLYQLSYTAESLAAQMKNPQNRLLAAAVPAAEAVGGKFVSGGFTFGEYDGFVLVDVPNDESMAAIAFAVSAGGAIKDAKSTKVISGDQWVTSMKLAADVAQKYKASK